MIIISFFVYFVFQCSSMQKWYFLDKILFKRFFLCYFCPQCLLMWRNLVKMVHEQVLIGLFLKDPSCPCLFLRPVMVGLNCQKSLLWKSNLLAKKHKLLRFFLLICFKINKWHIMKWNFYGWPFQKLDLNQNNNYKWHLINWSFPWEDETAPGEIST